MATTYRIQAINTRVAGQHQSLPTGYHALAAGIARNFTAVILSGASSIIIDALVRRCAMRTKAGEAWRRFMRGGAALSIWHPNRANFMMGYRDSRGQQPSAASAAD
jgi:hypothetical protein